MDELSTLETILELGWPGILMIAAGVLWRSYTARTQQLIDNLREEKDDVVREKEMLLGIVLDNAKMRFDAARTQFPRGEENSMDTKPLNPDKVSGD